jgi:hypothetical protein
VSSSAFKIDQRYFKIGTSDINLWRLEVSGYWRMSYTIEGTDIEIICFILDILDHDSYNKKFGYKKK